MILCSIISIWILSLIHMSLGEGAQKPASCIFLVVDDFTHPDTVPGRFGDFSHSSGTRTSTAFSWSPAHYPFVPPLFLRQLRSSQWHAQLLSILYLVGHVPVPEQGWNNPSSPNRTTKVYSVTTCTHEIHRRGPRVVAMGRSMLGHHRARSSRSHRPRRTG